MYAGIILLQQEHFEPALVLLLLLVNSERTLYFFFHNIHLLIYITGMASFLARLIGRRTPSPSTLPAGSTPPPPTCITPSLRDVITPVPSPVQSPLPPLAVERELNNILQGVDHSNLELENNNINNNNAPNNNNIYTPTAELIYNGSQEMHGQEDNADAGSEQLLAIYTNTIEYVLIFFNRALQCYAYLC